MTSICTLHKSILKWLPLTNCYKDLTKSVPIFTQESSPAISDCPWKSSLYFVLFFKHDKWETTTTTTAKKLLFVVPNLHSHFLVIADIYLRKENDFFHVGI